MEDARGGYRVDVLAGGKGFVNSGAASSGGKGGGAENARGGYPVDVPTGGKGLAKGGETSGAGEGGPSPPMDPPRIGQIMMARKKQRDEEQRASSSHDAWADIPVDLESSDDEGPDAKRHLDRHSR